MTSSVPGDLPRLDSYRAVLFDLDGVLTPTADIHMHAWRTMFTELFTELGITTPYTDDDYFRYVDGKQRDDGVISLLGSRGVTLPLGTPTDPPTADTVWGVGNRKNVVFSRVLEEDGIAAYPGSRVLIDALAASGMPMAVVSSSKNATWVLRAAGITGFFGVVVDGVVAADEGLASKPAPDMFLDAARKLGVDPGDAVVFEDAISGVAAAHAGSFGLVVGVNRGVGVDALRAAGATVVVDDLVVFAPQEVAS